MLQSPIRPFSVRLSTASSWYRRIARFQSPIRPFPLRQRYEPEVLLVQREVSIPYPAFPTAANFRRSRTGRCLSFNPLSGLSHCGWWSTPARTSSTCFNPLSGLSHRGALRPERVRRWDRLHISIPYPAFPTAAQSRRPTRPRITSPEFQSPFRPFPLRPDETTQAMAWTNNSFQSPIRPFPLRPTPRSSSSTTGSFNPLSGLSHCGRSITANNCPVCGRFQSPIRPFPLRRNGTCNPGELMVVVSIPYPAFLAAACLSVRCTDVVVAFQSPIRPFSLRLNDKRFIGTVVTVSFNPLSGLSHCGTRPEAGGEEPAQ